MDRTPGSGGVGTRVFVDSEPTGLVTPTALASTGRQAQLDLLSGRKCTSYPPTRVLVDC
jgi:hypothetical protein